MRTTALFAAVVVAAAPAGAVEDDGAFADIAGASLAASLGSVVGGAAGVGVTFLLGSNNVSLSRLLSVNDVTAAVLTDLLAAPIVGVGVGAAGGAFAFNVIRGDPLGPEPLIAAGGAACVGSACMVPGAMMAASSFNAVDSSNCDAAFNAIIAGIAYVGLAAGGFCVGAPVGAGVAAGVTAGVREIDPPPPAPETILIPPPPSSATKPAPPVETPPPPPPVEETPSP